MGKLGGRELNYASDVDVMFVTDRATVATAWPATVLRIARGCFRVDVDLRPEGRSGPLTRSLDGFRSYWDRRADAWEFQALLKARPVAGGGRPRPELRLGRRPGHLAAQPSAPTSWPSSGR